MPSKNKAPQGRRWTVDTHPERETIIATMVSGAESLRSIGKRYGISSACMTRYMQDKLVSQAQEVISGEGNKHGTALLLRIEKIMKRMNKLYDACDDYLRHPDDPERYDLGPKAWEIEVAFKIPDPHNRGKTLSGHDTLNNLLAKLEHNGIRPGVVRFRHSDPRKLIIDTAGVLSKQLELIGKIQGQVQVYGGDTTVVNVLVVPQKAANRES